MSGFTKAFQDTKGKTVVHDKVSGLKVDIVDLATKVEKTKGLMDEEVEESIKQIINFLNSYSTINKPKILDVGCCTGRELRQLHSSYENPVELYGVDLMSGVLEKAKELGPKDCVYKEGDIHKLPFNDDYFDVVYCKRVLIHSPDVKKAIDEMIRVVKPGGLVLFIEGDISAFHFHSTDSRMALVESEKQKSTVRSTQNPNIVSLTRSIVMKLPSVDNVSIR